jgi:hypothetical protein
MNSGMKQTRGLIRKVEEEEEEEEENAKTLVIFKLSVSIVTNAGRSSVT